MSLGTLTPKGSNQTIRTRSKPNISSDIVIKKPPTLADKCSLQTNSKHFPVIGVSPQKEKKPAKKSVSSSESLEFWLKPGISLPKLHSKNVPQERVDAGEPFTCFSYSNLSKKQTEFELYETPPDDSVKCLRRKSESLEGSLNFTGPSPCRFSFKVSPSDLDLDNFQAEEEVIKADNALKNWRTWNERHKKQERYLSKRLNKKPHDLLLQTTDLYRQEMENKIIIAASQIPIADKWRGHPCQWEGPLEAKKKKRITFKFQETEPACFLQHKPSQKGIIPDLEFINTPDLIRKEKHSDTSSKVFYGLVGSSRKFSDATTAVIQKRVQKFLKSRDRVRPSSDNFASMTVVGNKIPQAPEQVSVDPPAAIDVPLINVIGPEDDSFCLNFRQSVFCLVINGTEIKYELYKEPGHEKQESYSWELDFGVNEPDKLVEKTLQIENKGTMAVRYKWISKLEIGEKLNIFTPKQHEPSFFFDKNSGIFLPGQIYNLKFYYHTRKSGVQRETWYLKTIPSLDGNGGLGTIVLSAVASSTDLDLPSHILEAYLRERLRDSVVKFILNIIFMKVTISDENLYEVEYQSLFSEKELFEYHNSKYYYHSEMVVELNKLFEKIPSNIQNTWDLSLDSLKNLISITTKGKEREYLLSDLRNIAKAGLKPNRVFSREEKKYRMAYNILCKMANFMEADYDYLKNLLSNKKRGSENSWDYCMYAETVFSSSSEEKGESDFSCLESLNEIKPINLIYFQTMLYMKVYHRVSEAIENIVGMLETSKKFEPSGNINYKKSRPLKASREFDLFSCLQIFSNN